CDDLGGLARCQREFVSVRKSERDFEQHALVARIAVTGDNVGSKRAHLPLLRRICFQSNLCETHRQSKCSSPRPSNHWLWWNQPTRVLPLLNSQASGQPMNTGLSPPHEYGCEPRGFVGNSGSMTTAFW